MMTILTDTFVRGSNYTQGVYDDFAMVSEKMTEAMQRTTVSAEQAAQGLRNALHEWDGTNADQYRGGSFVYDDWSPDLDVSCALPDLRYVFYLALGAVVVVAALVGWLIRRVNS